MVWGVLVFVFVTPTRAYVGWEFPQNKTGGSVSRIKEGSGGGLKTSIRGSYIINIMSLVNAMRTPRLKGFM